MSTAVYSTLFIEASSESLFAEYAVSDDDVVIVRDIVAVSIGEPLDTVLVVSNASTNVAVFYHLFTDAYEYVHWDGRQVIPGGSTLSAQSAGGNSIQVRISGYLLTK